MKRSSKSSPSPVKSIPASAVSKSFDYKAVLIAALAIVSYGLSVFNNYALDDFIVLVKNRFVQQGFTGIWDILSKDTFAGMTDANVMVLAGGRYRPLSVVTFAMEQQFFHGSAFISHLINVLLYALTGILLFNFLKKLQPQTENESIRNSWGSISFFTACLFMALPAHSEPVINIKGRDDILCLLFFLLSAIQLFKYVSNSFQQNKNLIYSAVFFFLSLMSKESAVTFVAVIPLLLFIFTKTPNQKIVKTTFVFAALSALFILFRFLATKDNNGTVSVDILNNPFVNATTAQRLATVFYTWLLYLKLLVFPMHMSYDYNFNQIQIMNFSNWQVLLSILIHAALLVAALVLLKSKSVYAFAILFYFITFSIVSNFFFNIGAPFADRFMYIPSIGFCLVVVTFVLSITPKITSNNLKVVNQFVAVFFSVIIVVFVIRNISRCDDWKDNNTLFIHDTEAAPNSAKVQLNAGIGYINMANEKSGTEKSELLDKAIPHLKKGIEIYPTYLDGYLNMGVVYNWKGDYVNAELWWNKANEIKPGDKKVKEYEQVLATYYLQEGLKLGGEKKLNESINNLLHALKYDSINTDILYNLGGAYYTIPQLDSAKYYWSQTLKVKPDHKEAAQGLAVLQSRGI